MNFANRCKFVLFWSLVLYIQTDSNYQTAWPAGQWWDYSIKSSYTYGWTDIVHSDQLLWIQPSIYWFLFTFPKCLRTSRASFSCVSNFCKSNGRTRISWSFLNDESWARKIADGKEIVRSSSAYKKVFASAQCFEASVRLQGPQGDGVLCQYIFAYTCCWTRCVFVASLSSRT